MSKLKNTLLIAVIACFVLYASGKSFNKTQDADADADANKRVVVSAFTTAVMAAVISVGGSLVGTSVSGLIAPGYSVGVGGSITNYCNENMIFKTCSVIHGVMDVHMSTVAPGEKEGFASHKLKGAWRGTQQYCLYKIKDARVHIMYSAPNSFIKHKNRLAVAITDSSTTLDAVKMYDDTYPYLSAHYYYESITPVDVCNQGFCILGTMGGAHISEISIDLYPRRYKNLNTKIKEKLKANNPKVSKKRLNEKLKERYEDFIQEQFHRFVGE